MRIGPIDIEFSDTGNKEAATIVLAHGLGSNMNQWEKQISYFSKKYRVIAFSLQGHGGSSKPEAPEFYTIESYANSILQLLKELKINSCIWLGNSMGGVLGYHLRKNYPNIISVLITNGTTPKLIFSPFMLKTVEVVDKLLIKIMKFEGYVRFAAKNVTKYKDVQERIFQIMSESCPRAIISSHRILGNYDYLKDLEASTCHVHIIESEDDRDINSQLKKYRTRLEVVPIVFFHKMVQAGHICNMEKPDQYNEIVEKILEK